MQFTQKEKMNKEQVQIELAPAAYGYASSCANHWSHLAADHPRCSYFEE